VIQTVSVLILGEYHTASRPKSNINVSACTHRSNTQAQIMYQQYLGETYLILLVTSLLMSLQKCIKYECQIWKYQLECSQLISINTHKWREALHKSCLRLKLYLILYKWEYGAFSCCKESILSQSSQRTLERINYP